jgi:hypothetical protein
MTIIAIVGWLSANHEKARAERAEADLASREDTIASMTPVYEAAVAHHAKQRQICESTESAIGNGTVNCDGCEGIVCAAVDKAEKA